MGADGLARAPGVCGRVRAALCGAIFGVSTGVLLCGQSAPLHGQQVQFRQQTRLVLPTRFSIQNGVLDLQQKIGVSIGARLNLNFSPRLSVATGVAYVPALATLRAKGRQVALNAGTQILTAGTRVIYWLVPADRGISWEVHGGVGIGSGGERYRELLDRATFSAMVGTAVYWEIGQLVRLSLRVQERLYRAQLGGVEPSAAGKPFRVALGIGFPFLQTSLQRLRVLP
jgi:hypothetical protein